MAKNDLKTVGVSGGARTMRVAASATRFYVGEPIMSTYSLTAGVASVNTVVVLTDNKPVIGTDNFLGVAAKDAEVNTAGTVTAHKTQVVVPIPYVTRIRGKAKTATNVDTDSELLGVLFDTVVFDLTTSTYTIDDAAQANTGGLQVVDGNIVKQTLDVVVDARAMRQTIS